MSLREYIPLTRDVDAVQVPYGTPVVLSEGSEVAVTQSLGDTYTAVTDRGVMVRIAGKDADALGLDVQATHAADVSEPTSAEDVEKIVWERLATCYDPEIPVNIVDLGLIYHCAVHEHPEGGYKVEVRMTLTAPGCGMGDVIAYEAQQKIRAIPGVKEAEVGIVFDPPWSMDMMTEAARLELGMG